MWKQNASAILAPNPGPERSSPATEVLGSGEFIGRAAPFEPATTAKGQNGVTLNLVNAPVQQAAKVILGDILHLNYTVSDKVGGSITIQTTAPVDIDALADTFEAALKINGAGIVRAGNVYRVVPLEAASAMGTPLKSSDRAAGPGIQVQIVSLRHVSASEMKRILEPITNQGAILRTDEARSILVVTGTKNDLANINALVEIFDVDWMQGMSVGLYPVKSSDPEAIAKELAAVFGLDRDGPLKGVMRVIPNRRLGSVLVISSKPQHLSNAKQWIDKLDQGARQTEPQLFVYKIQNRPASELAALLQKVLSTSGDGALESEAAVAPRFEPATLATQPTKVTRGERQALSGSVSSPVGIVSNGLATEQTDEAAAPSVTAAGRAKVVADEQNNALLIEAVPKDYDRILHILDRLDVLPTQVMLEAVIAEVSLNDDLKFGLKWFFERNQHRWTFTDAVGGAVASSFPGFSYFFAAKDVRIALDALSEVTEVNVVSAPSLMVMDSRKATLQIGDQVPIVTQTAQSITDPNAPIVNAVEMRDTGVILTVMPRVNDSGRVLLEIEQEVSDVARTTSSGIDSPTIQQRRVRTTVAVLDGEVIALGGLIQQRDSRTQTQVPILGNLPVVGPAFRAKDDGIKRTELIIFIRPLVVRDGNEARQVTEEYRSRISLNPLAPTRGRRHFERDANRILH